MISGKPAKGGFDREGYDLALHNYERINGSLLSRPVTPGFAWDAKRKRLVLRGEFANVPRRFLDLSERSEGYGDVDDRAGEFEPMGIVDGDDLLRWMQTAVRPRRKDFRFTYESSTLGRPRAQDKRRQRQRAQADGKCIVCATNPRRTGRNNRGGFYRTCYWCNAKAMERVARAREQKKESIKQLTEALESA